MFHPFLSILIAVVCGFVAGCCTGILNTRLKINSLLAGILMMTMLYSINLRIMGRSNIQLLTVDTILTPLENLDINRFIPIILFFLIVTIVMKILLDLFLHTQLGFAMRATGDNEQMIRTLGVNTDRMTILGLGISNAFVALSGALVSQDQGFADIGMGIGMIVSALAAIIIGETLVKTQICPAYDPCGRRRIHHLQTDHFHGPAVGTCSHRFKDGHRYHGHSGSGDSCPEKRKGEQVAPERHIMLELKGVRKVFNAGTADEKVAIDDIDISLDKGDFLTIIGSNGAGKTTLLNLIYRNLPGGSRRYFHRWTECYPSSGT